MQTKIIIGSTTIGGIPETELDIFINKLIWHNLFDWEFYYNYGGGEEYYSEFSEYLKKSTHEVTPNVINENGVVSWKDKAKNREWINEWMENSQFSDSYFKYRHQYAGYTK